MKAIYMNEKEKLNMEDIKKVAEEIKKGKNVVFPTETVYGIGTSALNNEACEKVFEIKGRPKNKPLIVLISNYEMLNKIANPISELESKIMNEFWPGPLTIILQKSEKCHIPNAVTAGGENIGIRMTSGKIANMLIEKSGVPIVAPSANLSGNPTGKKMSNIRLELEEKVDYILDCGDLEDGIESTIIQVKNEKIIVLREGKIKREELRKFAEVE